MKGMTKSEQADNVAHQYCTMAGIWITATFSVGKLPFLLFPYLFHFVFILIYLFDPNLLCLVNHILTPN